MTVMSPSVVLHYRERADHFFHAAAELATMQSEGYATSVGLLSVHGCIALADAVLVAVEGTRTRTRTKADDHAQAARRLRGWCSSKGLSEAGLKHFEWLLGQKNHFSYDDAPVKEEHLLLAKVKMEQFFAWAFQTFPAVAQMREPSDA